MVDPFRPDLDWLGAWIIGRAFARGLPLPFRDRGGWRAEIGSDSEQRRWLFDSLSPDFIALARQISEPGNNLRAFCEGGAMRAVLPERWEVGAPSYAMTVTDAARSGEIPDGFRLELRTDRRSAHAAILTPDGELTASGHAGIGDSAFVYDRIVTRPGFERRGLGTAIMHALGKAVPSAAMPQILVATEAGCALYQRLGWKIVSPYSSANLKV